MMRRLYAALYTKHGGLKMANYIYLAREGTDEAQEDELVLCDSCAKKLKYFEFEQLAYAPADTKCIRCGGVQADQGQSDPDVAELAEQLATAVRKDTLENDEPRLPTERELEDFIDLINHLLTVSGIGATGVEDECNLSEKILLVALVETFPILKQLSVVPAWDMHMDMTHAHLHHVTHLIVRMAYTLGFANGSNLR
jgi:hypothetical protein